MKISIGIVCLGVYVISWAPMLREYAPTWASPIVAAFGVCALAAGLQKFGEEIKRESK